MIDERSRKKLILEHSRRMNAADVDGLLELYADEVCFEDPVGSDRRSGRDALRAHFEELVAAEIEEVPGQPVAGQDGVHVLVPVTATMNYLPLGPVFAGRGWLTEPASPENKRITWDYVVMMRAGAGGLIQELQMFWGRSDIGVAD
ncbi:nuclear transport factor 2 family protein [Streptomyces coffeae]|uniref:Nuclear transport factor 2 family protein n=1 Tax=Streptomyces coffeae TaxID=621382 RepID=A0ABS1NR68_9ACTN|nr:nuclear transport factor 2 family protein [Streptomyces coffeae]MBL1102601.1 nuclear transport factor 2 family protein [Streptomyces coffeae]